MSAAVTCDAPREYDERTIDWEAAHAAGQPFAVCKYADDGVWLTRMILVPARAVNGAPAFEPRSVRHNMDRVTISPALAEMLAARARELGLPANHDPFNWGPPPANDAAPTPRPSSIARAQTELDAEPEMDPALAEHFNAPETEPQTAPRMRVSTAGQETRPDVKLTADVHEGTAAMIAALKADTDLFSRSHKLVHVVASEEVKKGDVVVIPKGTPTIREIPLAVLVDRVSANARCLSWDGRKKEYAHKPPPRDRVRAVLERGVWPGIRELRGVIETPTMRPDGSIVEREGYDATTGFIYAPSAQFDRVRDAPTRGEAQEALRRLAHVWCDFPWASEPSRYVPVAAVLTLIGRPAIQGPVPMFLYDANTRGSGKTLAADAVSTIATGRTAPRGTFPPDVEELEKVLSAYALRGATIIGFDNIEVGLGGAPLDKVLTATTVDFRVLGKSEQPTLPWNATILASGNNVQVLRDIARRVVIGRIESPLEKPEERDRFAHDPLLPWVMNNRPRLVVDALTILRAFIADKRPAQRVGRFGMFDAWTDLVVQAIVFAGGANVLEARPGDDTGDGGELAAISAFYEGLPGLAQHLTCREMIQHLYPDPDPRAPPREPDRHDALREAIEFFAPLRAGKPDAKKLGAQLRRLLKRVVGNKRLVGKPDPHSKVMRWSIENL